MKTDSSSLSNHHCFGFIVEDRYLQKTFHRAEKKNSAILVMQNYMLERFLERVSLSPYRSNFIMKGGFLIASFTR